MLLQVHISKTFLEKALLNIGETINSILRVVNRLIYR